MWKRTINITALFDGGLDIQTRTEKAIEILTGKIGEDFPELENVIGAFYDITINEGALEDNFDEALCELYDFADLNDIRIISGSGKTDERWNVRRWMSEFCADNVEACSQG